MLTLTKGSTRPATDDPAPLARAATARDIPSTLVAFMAYEIRQPLMAVSGVLELLRDTPLSTDQREMLEIARRGVSSLGEMVGNVQDLARLEAGRLGIANSPFDVRATVENCVDLLAVRAADRDLDLDYQIDSTVPSRVVGDQGRFRQVLITLIGNALKHTERGCVHLAVTGEARPKGRVRLHVAVADTGPGIPKEIVDRLFQPAVERERPGGYGDASTGLALSVCRELAGLMGGGIWVESEHGKGSTFHFTVEAAVADQAPAERAGADLAGKRFLVVDDCDLAGRHTADLLERWGGCGVRVTDGARALARIRAGERYDAILIDSHMPGLTGRALAAEIGLAVSGHPTPLILMTTLRREAGIDEEGRTARFAAYVSKPVKPARLREVVGAVLAAADVSCDQVEPTSAKAPEGVGAAPRPAAGPLAEARIVVVDDDPHPRRLLERVLRRAGAAVTVLTGGGRAIDHVRRERPDLVILDALMPELDGFEACRRLKHDPATRLIPVILATALDVEEHRVRALEAGADDLLGKPFDISRLVARVAALVRAKGFTDGLEPAESVIVAMAQCIEGKDPNTHGHCERLADHAAQLGRRLGLPPSDVEALRLAGIVHDIGKVAVPDAILLKPGALTDDEWVIMRRHPTEGERICAGMASFRRVLPIIRHHHERMDGTGYPDGLRADDIPVTARVLQIVDIFDALTTSRPYRVPLTPAEALDYMAGEVERGWRDPHVFTAFREMIEERLAEEVGEPALAATA